MGSALRNFNCYYIILAPKLKHLWLAKCVINNTYISQTA